MNPFQKKVKQTHMHLRCVVCGDSFASKYCETSNSFPPFHLEPAKDYSVPCEDMAYAQLLYLMTYLHSLNNSVSMTHLIFEYNWEDYIVKKKEFLRWCLETGYLTIDNFSRIEIPDPVSDRGADLFEAENLDQEDKLLEAIEVLKQLLKQMIEEGELEPVAPEDVPIKSSELELGPSKLYKNIDTSKVEKRSEKPGMVTAGRTGASDVDKRMSTAASSMERRRLDQKK